MGYGERIAALREQIELTQEELAERIGISRAALSHYEKNRRQPDYETLSKIATFFNVTTDFLLGRDSNPDIQSISTLGNRISELRKEKDLTQEELANVIHVNRATLANWEIDRATPDPSSLQVLADYFNISVDFLLGRVTDPNAEAATKIAAALQDNPELLSFWQDLSQREDLQLMFKQVRDLSPETIRKVVRIIKAIEDEEAE